MQFVIHKSDLLRELQIVTGVVEKRATLPILANLLLETTKTGLQVGASDLEVTIRGTAKAEVQKEGSVTLPAGKLHEITRTLPDAEVTFKLEDRNQVRITCDRTRYRIASQPRDEFPNFPDLDESEGVKLPAKTLNQLIERVVFSITTEDPRYSLNGALFMLKEGYLTLVATDGHRLAYITKKLEKVDKEKDLKVIVPRKALTEISKMTDDMTDQDEVVFGQSDKHVFFVVGEHRLTSNVLEGSFPRFENVMPKACETSIVVPTDDLTAAVKRVSLLANDRLGRAVRLGLSSGKLELSSRTEMGEAEETLNLDYDGAEMNIGFNARYLLDFLNVVASPSVRLELNPIREGEQDDQNAGDKPGQLRPDPDDDFNYRYVVMPMHL
jgi:DNA polymerase-3 subunit beta